MAAQQTGSDRRANGDHEPSDAIGARKPAIWFPTIRTNTGTDQFTRTLCEGLKANGLRAEIAWIDPRAEYLPWTVRKPPVPQWANILHINTWLHRRFYEGSLPVVATSHHCVHAKTPGIHKGIARSIYHRAWIAHVERLALERANTAVAVSQFTADQTRARFGTDNLTVIHNGVDTTIFRPPTSDARRDGPVRILYVGSWSTRKGSDLLAPIMQHLGAGFQLRHTGTREQARRWGLDTETVALGRLSESELVGELQQADVFLFPSRLEGFGLAVAEAMACGTAVVASDASSLPEIITDRVDGLLCRAGDPAHFAATIRRLTDNPTVSETIAAHAPGKVNRLFAIDRFIDAHIALYSELLA